MAERVGRQRRAVHEGGHRQHAAGAGRLGAALGHLAQYRLQERAAQAVAEGNIAEATQCLSTLGTRLLAAGQTQLAKVALTEARRLEKTQVFSEGGKKNLKYTLLNRQRNIDIMPVELDKRHKNGPASRVIY